MAGGGEGVGAGRDVVHVVMFPFLAFGHISPFVQLARRLVSGEAAGVRVTFLTAAGIAPRVEAMLESAAGAVRVVPLSLPEVDAVIVRTVVRAHPTPERGDPCPPNC